MKPDAMQIDGCATIDAVVARVRRLLEISGIQDVVVVRIEDATYQEIRGVVWPFKQMLQNKHGARLTCGAVLPAVSAAAVREGV